MKQKKEDRLYEVGVSVRELWIFEVEAPTAKEALRRAKRGEHPSLEQKCSGTGNQYVRRIK